MGTELATPNEWNNDQSLDWHLTAQPLHGAFGRFLEALGTLYRELPPLWRADHEPEGFAWIDAGDRRNSVMSFVRRDGADHVVVVLNLTPVPRENYRLGVPLPGFYREILNTDAAIYGGSNVGNLGGLWADGTESHGRPCSITLTVPPLATVYLERQG
jgi:1,4-alpha-glucan branching enzyme